MRHATTLSDLFVGDGREKFMPYFPLPGTRPLPMTRSALRAQAARLDKKGYAAHSAEGGTLWATLAYCVYSKVAYKLSFTPAVGFMVEIDKTRE